MSEVSTQSEGPEAAPSTGEKRAFEPLKDHFGEEAEYDPERYPEGSPAREGSMTRPSGQGGASPKRRPDYQDQWPEMPEPSESAKAKGELNDRVAKGEVPPVPPPQEDGFVNEDVQPSAEESNV